ncbi:MAG TPA: hypothetical protein VH309_04650, partial [Elusimicrobiota bacterium]|nr:hypothetical protein [Elusimicrobiota bacterium]
LAPASAAAAPPPPPPAALQAAPAASIPEGDGSRGGSAAPEAAARPSSSPSSRIGAVLRRLANPFGTRSAEPVRAPSEAARLDREFSKLDLWSSVGPAAKSEIEGLRARKLAKAQTRAYVRREVNAAFARVMAARGTGNLGFHFNLHGGAREGYVGAGIRASKGDIALRYSTNGDFNDKVYFFQTSAHDAYTALDASNGELLFFPSRMGYALSVFAVDAPELRAARADGRIDNLGSISMDFHKGMRGVPYSAFLAPPSEVFVRTARKVGLKRLSRDEETLATARYLEAVLRAGGAFVPR